MNYNYVKISVKPETMKRLKEEFLTDYLHHHPEMKHIFISQDAMINILIDYWLQ